MVAIQDWTASDQVDNPNNFGYNDYVLTMDGQGILPEDAANATLAAPPSGDPLCTANQTPAAGVCQARALPTEQQVQVEIARIGAGGTIQNTDQIFRMVRDGRTFFVLRRSRFTDECRVTARPNNGHNFSENMTRAIAFIGGFSNGADATGELWCRRHVDGVSQDNIESPWDLSTQQGQPGLGNLQSTLNIISEIRAGRMPSSIPTGDQARARALAGAVDAAELNTLTTWTRDQIAIQRAPNEIALSDWHTARAAIIFTLVGGGITLLLSLLWGGTGGGGDGGSGGGGSGGGGFWSRLLHNGVKGVLGIGSKSNAATAPAPQTAAPRVALGDNSVVNGILAYHRAAGTTTPTGSTIAVPQAVGGNSSPVVGFTPVPVIAVPVTVPAPIVVTTPVIEPIFVPAL